MTEPQSDFNFDEQERELHRGGKLLPLNRLQAALFGAVWRNRMKGPVTAQELIDEAGVKLSRQGMHLEMRDLNRWTRRLSIRLVSSGRGYFVVFDAMPPKWKPDIPPVTDDPELMKIPT